MDILLRSSVSLVFFCALVPLFFSSLKLNNLSISSWSPIQFTLLILYFQELPPISVNEVKTVDGAVGLELKAISRATFRDGFWNFLGRYGFRYGDSYCRSLLPYEVKFSISHILFHSKFWYYFLASTSCYLSSRKISLRIRSVKNFFWTFLQCDLFVVVKPKFTDIGWALESVI